MHFSASTFILISSTLFAPILCIGIFECRKCYLAQICIIILKIGTGSAPSNGAIWNEFSEHHIQCAICTFLLQIKCRYNANFGWAAPYLGLFAFSGLIVLHIS